MRSRCGPPRGRLFALVVVGVLLFGCGGTAPAHPPKPAPILPDGPPVVVTVVEDPGAPIAGPRGPTPKLDDLLGEPEGRLLFVHFIDVGQGDSALVITPNGKTVLIDTGPKQAGERLLGYLDDLGVHKIDLLLNSHAHADHIGNAAAVLNEMVVGRILDSGFPHPSPVYEAMLAAIQVDLVPVKVARKGRIVELDEGISMEVLSPNDPLLSGSRSDPNANSVVVRIDYDQMHFLFVGDAEAETESRLLRTRDELPATVLKVAHHGSRFATTEAFLRAVNPRIAVVSCSEHNNYGHPAPETLERLSAHGVATLTSPTHGNVIMATDGRKLKVVTVPREGGPYGGAEVWTKDADAHRLASSAAGGTPPSMLNLNSATVEQLIALPGIGPKIASAIIADREKRGPFHTVDDLARVKGIGPSKVNKLRALVTVSRLGAP